jgi:hypothetical protein
VTAGFKLGECYTDGRKLGAGQRSNHRAVRVFALQKRCGADMMEIDHKADLGTARRELGDRVSLIGNLDPVGHLLFGTVREVEKAALDTARRHRYPERRPEAGL